MVQSSTPRIGQTTIRPTTPQQVVRTTTPVMRPLTTIRGQTTIVQTQANNQVPALHPVSGTTIISGGTTAQVFVNVLCHPFQAKFYYLLIGFISIISSRCSFVLLFVIIIIIFLNFSKCMPFKICT